MIVIYTGNSEIDRELEKQIKGSMVVGYFDFIIEDDKFAGQTVIVSDTAITEDFKKYLYLLRSKDIRVILILKKQKSENTKIALETGIYDLVFGTFYPSEIINLIDNPKSFKDIAKLYKKAFDITGIKWGDKRKWIKH